jgi:hypothetical protein
MRAIEQLRSRGYAVSDTLGRCSLAEQIRPIVRWQNGNYRIVAAELSVTQPVRTVTEDLRLLPDLKRVRVAATSDQLRQLRALRPDLTIER